MICNHGTYDGFFLDVVLPMASSISFRSSDEMRGWTAGDSKIITNHKIDQINPMPPIYFMVKHSKEIISVNWLTMYCKKINEKKKPDAKETDDANACEIIAILLSCKHGQDIEYIVCRLFIPVFILHLFLD